VAVYPTYSFANHSCVCNSHTRKHKDLKLELVAQSDIKKGQQRHPFDKIQTKLWWKKMVACSDALKRGWKIYLFFLCAIFIKEVAQALAKMWQHALLQHLLKVPSGQIRSAGK
jgi:hypothetical protein